MKEDRIKVICVEDHELTMMGLLTLFERNNDKFVVVGHTDTGFKAFELCLEKKPDILILDYYLPGDWNGMRVIKEIRERKLPIKVLMLSMERLVLKEAVVSWGADMCLLKDEPNSVILDALLTLSTKSPNYSTISLRKQDTEEDEDKARFHKRALSKSELRVLTAASQGLGTNDIAAQLHMTPGTVGTHFGNIFKKLGVRDRTEAVSFAYRNKLI